MRTKFSGFLTLLLVLIAHLSFAQEKAISGKITDSDGLPLPGVNIVVKGTTNGTQSDFDGNYTIRASVGQVLLFTYVGQKDVERVIGASDVINVQMEDDAQALEEVVVTAQGIQREKKALGYAVSTVGSEDLEQKSQGDVARVLNGQASGVQINATNGVSGSATNIIIRGYTSISGSNQPLFIVDGVPFSSDTNAQGNFVDGNNGSSRFLDIDPNNIESINVLKGLAAANLYGTAGRNGVILITTKGGASGGAPTKSEITFSQSIFFNEIASLPDYQDEFGGGFDQAFGFFFSNFGPSFNSTNPADFGTNFVGFDTDGVPLITHPTQTNSNVAAGFPEFAGVGYRYQPYDNVEEFFRTGLITSTSINARGSSADGKISYNANYGYLDNEGFTPGNTLRRNTIGIGGKAELSNKFTINGTLNYARTDFVSPPIAASVGNGAFGAGSSVFGHVFFTPRSIDLTGLPFQNPLDGSTAYYRAGNDIQNPRWTVANAFGNQFTNRVFGNLQASYKITDNLNVFWRTGIDFFVERNENAQNRGGAEGNVNGFYQTFDNSNTIWDHTLQLNGAYLLTEDLDISFNAGVTSRRTVFSQQGVTSTQQVVFGVLRHFNFENQTPVQFDSFQNIVGAYGQAEFGYKGFAYLTLAGRNDWVSNFAQDNRSIFYPSASASFVPTAVWDGLTSQNGLNFLKVRAGYGTSAGFAGGFPVFNGLNLDPRDFQSGGTNVPSNSASNVLGNPNLEPERVDEIEVGIESRFLNNRISLDVSLFDKTTTDLITSRPLDPSTGFTSTQTNIGEVQVQGVEIDLAAQIIRNDNGFNWSLNANFTADESTVNDIGQDAENIQIAGFGGGLGNYAVEGRPFGVQLGTRIQRDANNNFVVNSTGSYIEEQGLFEIGDPNADWRLNVNNTLSYKGFSFNMSWAYRHGGDIYSNTVSTLIGRGLVEDTVDRLSTFVLPGVKQDGTPNDIQINNSDFFFGNVAFGPEELQVYDGSVLRLREVSLAYSVPRKLLEKTPFGSLTLTVSGQNLWFKSFGVPDSTNFDTDALGLGVGNGLGFEFLNGPSARQYGMSLKATF
ncbi:SusC/RagA family TonB-linked outer membrane protein [Leptobacterium flavescens]|uniref:SusC/RagA family TonB-linked outer membrane protein n=1 Tax=Leptobacterium flavescens TaxID=472055 RepID=A0A6P0UTJ1_9FLAO|nr:SusC/RagA family TonB-linked outer membrane protein [Leptobacterium flavescens]NER15159.1 SusC/RagA family TonB-linked outer membrane protein [Leptobacterium flavescens]